MREIKFRLIKDNKIIGYETHIVDKKINKGIGVYHREPDEEKLKYGYPITGGDKWFIFHDKKDQYTGLKDKNGKEIYEGDVVKNVRRAWMDSGSCGTNYFSNTGEVFWDKELASWEVKRGGGGSPDFSLYVTKKMPEKDMPPETNEVIGNIHINPELLKIKGEK